MACVEVVYATATTIDRCEVPFAEGMTLEQAIQSSGVLERHPEMDLKRHQVGVFGKKKELTTVLRENDRVKSIGRLPPIRSFFDVQKSKLRHVSKRSFLKYKSKFLRWRGWYPD